MRKRVHKYIDKMQSSNIDLVYLWVDGSDPAWQERKQRVTGTLIDDTEGNNKGRYINNDELRYSLRSVEKNVPWIRKIFIVTDNQRPEWLNDNIPGIEIVDHTEILPEEALPCFNSRVIEYFIYKIPGLSERFLYANDDLFFNTPLQPGYFFGPGNKPFVRLKKKLFRRWHYPLKRLFGKKLGSYMSNVLEAMSLVDRKYGVRYSAVPHHNVDAYVKLDYREAVEHVFAPQVKNSLASHTRMYGDLQRSAFLYYALAVGKAYVKYVGRKESSRILVHRHDFTRYIKKYQPDLFCLNDSQRVSDEDREKIRPFLESLFPKQSRFEK